MAGEGSSSGGLGGGSSPGSGASFSVPSTYNERLEAIVSQLNLYAGRYGQSMENLMKKIVENVEAEWDQARSVEEDKKRMVDKIVELSKWARKEGAEDGISAELVTDFMDIVKKLDRGFKMHSTKYQEATMSKMDTNKQDIERVGFNLTSVHKRLSETARHLSAIMKPDP